MPISPRRRLALVSALLAMLLPAMPGQTAERPNPYDRKLAQLPEMQRLTVLRRAVLDGGQPCRRVTAAKPGGRYKNLLMWSTRCVPGGDYGVFIGPDGTVQVSPCKDHAGLKLPLCTLPKVNPPRHGEGDRAQRGEGGAP